MGLTWLYAQVCQPVNSAEMLLWIFVKGAPPAPPRLRRARGALLAERCVARAGAVGILDEHNKAQVRRAAPGRGASGGAEAGA